MPSEGVIKRLCDYFSVDYSEGLAEFKAIYRAWGEANPEFEAFRNTYRRKSEGSKSPRRATVQGAFSYKFLSFQIDLFCLYDDCKE